MQKDIAEFMRRIKELGFAVKLDTNGCFPNVLRDLVAQGLVDFVAMDIKNSPERYAETVGIPGFDLNPVEESVAFLLSGAVDYEFRTTVVDRFHDEQSFRDIARWITGAKRYALQEFKDSGDILVGGLGPCTSEQMEAFLAVLKPLVPGAFLRGNE